MSNQVILIGNLGSDLNVNTTQSGKFVANVSIATNTTTQAGEKFTEWHRLTIWGDKALEAAKTFKKGSWVEVKGSIRHQTFIDKEGVERRVDFIVVGSINPGPRKNQQKEEAAPEEASTTTKRSRTKKTAQANATEVLPPKDLPF